jgi:SpoVK/Ycf46/Vps4 family AAA+-type ATPase
LLLTYDIMPDNWSHANQQYLMSALASVRITLQRHAARVQNREPVGTPENTLTQVAETMTPPPALESLCRAFGLSSFERAVVLLCAGIELDSAFAALCAEAQGDPQKYYPTFELALAALPDAHWSALTPDAPLRRWRLIEIISSSTLTVASLRIDERILHYLAGVSQMDDRLAGIVVPVRDAGDLVPSHSALAERIAQTYSKNANDSLLPVVQLCGEDPGDKNAIAVRVAAMLGLNLKAISAQSIPTDPREREALIRLWEREAALDANALLIDCDEIDQNDAARRTALNHFLERTLGVLMVTTRERIQSVQRRMISLDVHKPSAREQRVIWQNALGEMASSLNGNLEALVSQFNLSGPAIRAASAQAIGLNTNEATRVLWQACQMQARPRLSDLAQRIEPVAVWNELVLPESQLATLRELAAHVRQRHQVYETWGFAAKSSRGLGISALFAGASGTGKTMAAEVLANELQLDLYRIDLSSVVSKYIGETEKNLRRVFDAAESGGAILLFDEADALFGKRSEIKDSHDRYANIEVSYLLQRMEAYRGLAILTTNMKESLDTAFLRRIRFVVNFPFPDAAQRAEIWRHIYPTKVPTEGIDANKLAQLNIAGGNIRNIALNAAFLAADEKQSVRMKHLLRAARSEYAKLDKPLTDGEIRDWVRES